jgi:hypothetical protein
VIIMPIDPSIPMAAITHDRPMPNVIQTMAEAMKVRSMEMELRQQQEAEQDDKDVKQALAEFNGDFEKAGTVLAQRGKPLIGAKLVQVAMAQRKAFNDNVVAKLKADEETINNHLQRVGAIGDQVGLTSWKEEMAKINPQIASMVPDTYVPETWEPVRDRLLSIGMTAKDQMTTHIDGLTKLATLRKNTADWMKEMPGIVAGAFSVVHDQETWDGIHKSLEVNGVPEELVHVYGKMYSEQARELAANNAKMLSNRTATGSERERYILDTYGPNPTRAQRDAGLSRFRDLTTRPPSEKSEGPSTAERARFLSNRKVDLDKEETRFSAALAEIGWERGKPLPAKPNDRAILLSQYDTVVAEHDQAKLSIENLYRDKMLMPRVGSLAEAQYGPTIAPKHAASTTTSAPATGGTKSITKAKLKLLAIRTGTSYEVEAARAKANNYTIIDQ